jgi:hypothetical protein
MKILLRFGLEILWETGGRGPNQYFVPDARETRIAAAQQLAYRVITKQFTKRKKNKRNKNNERFTKNELAKRKKAYPFDK